MNQRRFLGMRRPLTLTLMVGLLLFAYQNCSNNYKLSAITPDSSSADGTASIETPVENPAVASSPTSTPVGTPGSSATPTPTPVPELTGSIAVAAAHANPPLDLFFVIDNSGSMLGHQINLGQAFASVFQSNTASLADFDVNVFLFSTASTVNSYFAAQVPMSVPSTLSPFPLPNNTSALLAIPGSIYGMQNVGTGTYGVAPFSMMIAPAPVLDFDQTRSAVTASLHLAKKGNQSDTDYKNSIQTLTQQFQHRLEFLNPTGQLAYEQLTDISSGLCSVARILKHPTNYIHSGDSAAIILVSDDNDRLNVRNPYGNQCIESVASSQEIIDGTCGHEQATISYDSSATITYQTDTKFTYQSGTTIPYSFTNADTCSFTYSNGFKYTSTYTALQTKVTYTQCMQIADGTCVLTATQTQTIAGNYVNSAGNCSQDMSGLVTSPNYNSTYQCQAAHLANQVGPSGVDTASTGSQCSSQVLSSLSGSNKTAVTCTIGAANMVAGSASATPPSSVACTNYCASHPQYANCQQSGVSTTHGSLSFNNPGVTCNSQCPNSATCGTGTVAQYISTKYGASATCGTPSAILSTIVVNSAAPALTCASSLTGLTVTSSAGTPVCTTAGSATTVQACISSLQSATSVGAPIAACAVKSGDTSSVIVPTGVTCATTCANSGGYCDPTHYATVAAYLAGTKSALCKSAANAGAKSFNLVFKPSVAPTASCQSKCADVAAGSCDGKGWGASDGSTVANYVQSQLGGGTTCTSANKYIADVSSVVAPATSTVNACASYPNSSVFSPTDSAHAGSIATNYVAGDSNHLAADFQSSIVNQATQIFGANNLPALAVITQLSGDNLHGTDVGQDYINLAKAMNGANAQVYDILGNYNSSLGAISNFIVKSSQNTFLLTIPSTSTMDSVAIIRSGSSTSTLLAPTQWSWTGSTLSINSSAQLQIGDQLVYEYHN